MRRVLSTFADRLPNHGLLVLRVIAGTALIGRCVEFLRDPSLQTITPHVIAAGAGVFLLLGFWTPLAGAVVAVVELFIAFSQNRDPWLGVLLASVCFALALLGPGNWSVDARRSGWRRIEIRRPNS
jgi:putative oxidoreductase